MRKWSYFLLARFLGGSRFEQPDILQFDTLHSMREYCKAHFGKIRIIDEYAGYNPPVGWTTLNRH